MIVQSQSLLQVRRKNFFLPLSCFCLSLLVIGCRSQSKAPQALPLYANTIVKKNFRNVINAEGQIGNNNAVQFTSSGRGTVTQVLVDAGQQVQKGQVLLVLEHEQQSAALDTAKAKAEEAKIEASRYQSLAAVGAASREDAEEKKIAAIAAASNYIDKKVQLSHRFIKAPFDGVIGSSFIINVGAFVQEGDYLFYLVNNDELLVAMKIPAGQSKAIAMDQPVRIYRDVSNRSIAKGKINYIAPAYDVKPEAQSNIPYNTLTVQASFPNVGVGLKPLELLRAEIETGLHNFPAIPTAAITMKAQQAFVFKLIPVDTFLHLNKLDEQQSKPLKALPPKSLIAVESPVTLGPLQDNQFPVLKGLVPGEKVAISQTKVLSSGMPVQILPKLSAK
jgi:membrane fusion protein (multidrug efflux system)